MSTVINTIPKTAHESYSKRQRYEFEIFDKSIKEIENLFKQDIHTFKRPRLTKHHSDSSGHDEDNNNNNNNYTYHDSRQLNDYLKKDKRNDSYKSLFSINKQANQAVAAHQHHNYHDHKTPRSDEYHQLRDLYKKKQLEMSKPCLKPLVHPSIINHIRLETIKKIDYYVNDIFDDDDEGSCVDQNYNEDGLFLKNDKIIGNLINIIDSNR